VREGASLRGEESRWVRKDGTPVDISVTVSPILDEDGAVTGASSVARDITYRKETEARLQYLADHDGLTGLLNRRCFGRELLREILRAHRFGSEGAVIVIDLDNFKAINDTLGHRSGDQVIRRIGEVLRKVLREVDVVARIGGDEFAVFIPGGDAEQVAGRIGTTIKKTALGLGKNSLHTTASIGIAYVTNEKLNEDELLARADMAMYEAKSSGRDCFRIYRPEDLHRERSRAGLKMSERIRGAVDAGDFEVYAQPILDLAEDTIHQHELLVRMKDGDGGLIMPGAFLPTADHFGMIEDVDRWMMTQAIALLSRLNGKEEGICLSVNLSARSMVDPGIFRLIEHELEVNEVCPQNLAMEVTETSVIENLDDARRLVTRLKDLGCKLALDDFGAGFGSFYYLKHLPFDYLKIDGDFIRGLPGNQTDRFMVEAISNLASRLGKKTVAEFVENQETLDLLRDYGIDYAQGFHIGRPRPADFDGLEDAGRMAELI
ncbi:MAG: EAL domain-containing protein, partial [Actinomycetota bacterium]|nr:EAL domain-containing protein [Actinomycetota bacterium]